MSGATQPHDCAGSSTNLAGNNSGPVFNMDEWTENGTTLTTPREDYVGILISEGGLSKPTGKNTSVEKKIKRRGWSKQFFEK